MENISVELQNLFNEDAGLLSRTIQFFDRQLTILFVDGISSKEKLNNFVINPLLKYSEKKDGGHKPITVDFVFNVILHCELAKESELEKLRESLLAGDAVLFVEGEKQAIVIDNKGFATRGIVEPPTSAVLRGPREGFNENIADNISLIKRKIRSEKLVIKRTKVGRYTNTNVAIMYIDGIADKRIVRDLLAKIEKIDIDGVLDSAYITKYLEISKYSIFKQIGNTEKPDIVSAKMLEGRVCILVDGSPIALTVPFILLEDMQSSNDYFTKNTRASMLRVLRIFAVFLALFLPAVYIALVEHHEHILQFRYLLTIINATQNLTLTPKFEILITVVFFEILHESAVRMPRYVGMAVSVVGALVLGETAVKAGIISTPAVIIAALSGIALYNIPDQEGTFSTLRIFFVIVAGALGLYGLIISSMFVIIYLTTFESYYTPYLAPFSPLIVSDMKDAVIKKNVDELETRPKSIPNENSRRIKRAN